MRRAHVRTGPAVRQTTIASGRGWRSCRFLHASGGVYGGCDEAVQTIRQGGCVIGACDESIGIRDSVIRAFLRSMRACLRDLCQWEEQPEHADGALRPQPIGVSPRAGWREHVWLCVRTVGRAFILMPARASWVSWHGNACLELARRAQKSTRDHARLARPPPRRPAGSPPWTERRLRRPARAERLYHYEMRVRLFIL